MNRRAEIEKYTPIVESDLKSLRQQIFDKSEGFYWADPHTDSVIGSLILFIDELEERLENIRDEARERSEYD
jgi:hypothetical protein